MKKLISVVLICLLLFTTIVSAEPTYQTEEQTAKEIEEFNEGIEQADQKISELDTLFYLFDHWFSQLSW